MAMFGLGFVHTMLLDMSDGRDRGSSWNRERRLTDALIETTLRFDRPAPGEDKSAPPPRSEPPYGGLRTLLTDRFGRTLPNR